MTWSFFYYIDIRFILSSNNFTGEKNRFSPGAGNDSFPAPGFHNIIFPGTRLMYDRKTVSLMNNRHLPGVDDP